MAHKINPNRSVNKEVQGNSKKANGSGNILKINLRSATEFNRVLKAEFTFWIRQQFVDGRPRKTTRVETG